MKHPLQNIKTHTKGLFLWGLLVLLNLTLTNAFGQATLPTAHQGPWQAMSKTGWTQSGLGGDLTSELGGSPIGTNTAVFDTGGSGGLGGDNIVISFTGVPGTLTYYANITGLANSFGGTFVVEESVDGVTYTNLRTITSNLLRVAGGTLFTDNPKATSKFIKFRFQARGAQNFLLDAVQIAANNGPEINIKQGTADYLTGSTYTFAAQNVKTTSNAAAFTIQNTGTLDLNLSGSPLINISGTHAGEFSVVQNTTSSPVAPGGNTTYSVSFSPASFGNKSATLTIQNDDANENPYTINLAGSAIILAPAITGFSPAGGLIGSTVVITGTNLINTTSVTFNNTAASFVIDNDGQITATVPAGATPGNIAVKNQTNTATGGHFNVISQPEPTITGFTPTSGPIGQTVVITGTDFTGATSVTFNAKPAAYTVDNSTQITAIVPASATTGKIAITTPGGTVNSVSDFNVLLLPEITAISPDFGLVLELITITGVNFTDASDVSFNGVTAAYEVNSDTEIIAEVPAGATTGPITVTTIGGTAKSGTFTVIVSAPHISDISPASGQVLEIVTITGVNFTGASDVSFNGATAAYEINSDTEIIAEVPVGATTGLVTVTTSGGTATSSTFTVIVPAPSVSAISSTSGLIGDLVIISGVNFSGATNVSFNGAAAGYTVDNDGQITAQVPSGAITGPITVTTAGGVASSEIFTVIIPNTTYTWNVNTGNWTDPNSWTPVRNNLTTADILIFDGAKTSNPTVNLDFAASQTVGQLKFTNSVIANLTVASDKTLILDNGVAGSDLDVAANSTVTIDNTIADAELTLRITTGETGIVAGTIMVRGTAGTAAHRIFTEEVNGLIFQNGSTFRTGTNFSGNPFGTVNLNSVQFASGSTYRNQAGGSPFGAAAPNSVLLFDPGSFYRHEGNMAPDLNNRIYSNFEVNNAAFAQTVAGTGNLTLNNLTVSSATNFNVNLSGTVNIGGGIGVVAGALNFNPDAANNINMVGSGTKIISGAGTLSLGANARLNVPVGVIVDLKKQISGTGNVVVDGTIRTNVENGFAGGATTALNAGVTPTLNAGSTIEYYGLGAQTISPINYANLIIASNRSGATVTLNSGTIKVSELFTALASNLTYNATDNTVEFNGGAQIIPVLPYNNLIASGTAAKSIANNIQVNGVLNVNAATIATGANKITLNSGASIIESQLSYVLGQVEATRTVTSGASQNFGNVGLTLTPATGSLSPGITTVLRKTANGHIQLNPEAQSITRVYDITAQNISGLNTAMALKYAPNELTGTQVESELHMYKNSGDGTWLEQAGTYTHSTVAKQVTLAGVTGFSSWTLGEQSILLPVQLLDFTATRNGQTVKLNWSTVMEKENKGFEVQVSTDAERFTAVSFVNSKNPNSTTLQKYSFVDSKTKPADILYYRLKQVDMNGTESYSEVKAVTYDNVHVALEATAFPNPFAENFTVVVNADAQKLASITITDAMGRKVMEKTVTLNKGSNDIKFEMGNKYSSGIYIINLTTNNFQQHLRMVKK
jgi:trimeric autotransporter adhesin